MGGLWGADGGFGCYLCEEGQWEWLWERGEKQRLLRGHSRVMRGWGKGVDENGRATGDGGADCIGKGSLERFFRAEC